MTGSCERYACGSAQPEADAVRPFVAHRPGKIESRLVRQGISSTDKDVTDSHSAAVMVGGFSSSIVPVWAAASNLVDHLMGDGQSSTYAPSLVDGRCGRGLDSSVVSVKLPVGRQQSARRRPSVLGLQISGKAPEQMVRRFKRAVSRRWSLDRLRSKEVLPLVRRQPAWMEGTDPTAICRRTQQGIRRERPAL